MYFAELSEIRRLAGKAAEREGVPFYILRDPRKGSRGYTAVSSTGFGLPSGLYIEDSVAPDRERQDPDPPEKTSANGF